MDITVKKAAFQSEDRSWVAQDSVKEKGRLNATLDVSTFTEATHFPNGYIPSGVLLGRITATGKFGPYDAAATDGREVADSFLWNATPASVGGPDQVVARWVGPGVVNETRLPASSGIDAAAKTDLAAWFKFV